MEHRVDVLVAEDGRDNGVVVTVELFDEVTRTVGIVRTVSDLAVAALEAPWQRDVRRCVNRVADECLRRLACAADAELATGDQMSVGVVGQDDDRALGCDRELLGRDRLERIAEHVRVLEPDVREQDDAGAENVRRVEPTTETSASTTATSMPVSAKVANAAAVTISNCVASRSSACARTRATASSKSTLTPFNRIRSPQLATCGEIVEPTASPSESRSCSIVTVAVDFPFVPTTWIAG